MCFSQCASETLLFWSSVQEKSRFTSNLDSPRYKRDECSERKRNGKKCKHRKVLLKTQLGVRNVNREVFKAGNNCFKLSIIGLYLMSWTRARTNMVILGAARSTEKTTGLIVDKLLRLGFNIILDVGRSFKNIFFYKEKRIKSLLGGTSRCLRNRHSWLLKHTMWNLYSALSTSSSFHKVFGKAAEWNKISAFIA